MIIEQQYCSLWVWGEGIKRIMGWSLLPFFNSEGTPVPFNPPPKLVDTGPYTRVRNPMVSGVLITLFGVGVLLKSISLTFIFSPVLFVFVYIELKVIEEPELELRLGESYREYKKRVPMFFPRFPL
jgi:protein-S-isoprenylcysteine O-methyltransferase Ste14